MCKTYDCCGIFLAIFVPSSPLTLLRQCCFCYLETLSVIISVSFTGTMSLTLINKHSMVCFKVHFTNPFIGIPLSGMGTIYGITFNFLCFMSLVSHWRAAWADPGVIPKEMVIAIVALKFKLLNRRLQEK